MRSSAAPDVPDCSVTCWLCDSCCCPSSFSDRLSSRWRKQVGIDRTNQSSVEGGKHCPTKCITICGALSVRHGTRLWNPALNTQIPFHKEDADNKPSKKPKKQKKIQIMNKHTSKCLKKKQATSATGND